VTFIPFLEGRSTGAAVEEQAHRGGTAEERGEVEGAEPVGRPGGDLVPGVEELAQEFVVAEGRGLEEIERGVAIEECGENVLLPAIERRKDDRKSLVIAGGGQVAVAVEEGVDLRALTSADGGEEFVGVGHSPKVRGSGKSPQQYVPAAATPQLTGVEDPSGPIESLSNRSPPSTGAGARRSEVVPSPRDPDEFSPQHHADPLPASRAQVLNAAATTALNFLSLFTKVGSNWAATVLESPRWPELPCPQHRRSPDRVTAQVCSAPRPNPFSNTMLLTRAGVKVPALPTSAPRPSSP
jgi:hypothetical protein